MANSKSMLFRAPTQSGLPHLHSMLNSLGNDLAVSQLLGVSLSTIRRYRREGQAPRAIMLALFWETPWGASVLDAHSTNEARMAFTMNRMLERENKALKGQLETLERLLSEGNRGAANEHFFKLGS